MLEVGRKVVVHPSGEEAADTRKMIRSVELTAQNLVNDIFLSQSLCQAEPENAERVIRSVNIY